MEKKREKMRGCIKKLEMRVREIKGATEGEPEGVDLKGGKGEEGES